MITCIGEDVLDGEASVVRDADGPDLVALEACLRSRHDIFQVCVGDRLERGDVPHAFVGKESVNL